MTWVIKHKRSPGSRISAEYECPVHGRFRRDVERTDSGDPPDAVECEHETDMITDSGRPRWVKHHCGQRSEWRPTSARVKVRTVTAARRGKDPDPPPGAMDWQALAYDEMSRDDWDKKERKKDYEMTYNLFKKAL